MRSAGGIWLLLAGSAFLAGCSPDSEAPSLDPNRFPIGLYSVKEAGSLKAIQAAGFDVVAPDHHTFDLQEPIAKEARRLGLRLLGLRGALLTGPPGGAADWPVEAWYIDDEPDVNHHSAQWLEKVSQETRRLDPRPQTFVVGQGSAALTYGHVADAFMLDWYPVPHLPLDSIADHIDLAYSHLPKGKPLWMVVQAYDWRDEPLRKKIKIGRFPSHREIRFMSYLSIVHGARGLYYWTFKKPGGQNLLEHYPEQWQAVARVVREIKDLQPMFERGDEIPFPAPLSGRGLEGKAWRYQGRPVAVLVNRSTASASFPAEFLDSAWRPLFERHRDPKRLLVKNRGGWDMPAHRVIVFERRRW